MPRLQEPARLARRPHWGRYPIPWVVYVGPDGTPDFRVHREDRRRRCAAERRCQLCGGRFGTEPVTFIGFSHSLNGGRFGEPPLHRDCLDYALEVCPWLAGKPYSDRPGDPGTHFVTQHEDPLMVIYTCNGFKAIPDPGGEAELIYEADWATRPVEYYRRPSRAVS